MGRVESLLERCESVIKNGILRPTLGIVAISRNEERDIQGFLDHLLPWVDEIIIVDDGSTDRTTEIVEATDSKVTLLRNRMTDEGGFSEQRNLGIKAAKSDWLLNMDIDERVTPELAAEIKDVIQDTKLNAFRYRRLNYFMHQPMKLGGWNSWNNPQLARRGCHHYVNKVHERCVVEGEPNSIGQLHSEMWHLNDESYEERLRKSFQYSKIEANLILSGNTKVTWRHLFFKPPFEFIKKYILKRGFIDGVPGLISALHAAGAIFRAYALAWDEQNRIPREELEQELKKKWNSEKLGSKATEKVNGSP